MAASPHLGVLMAACFLLGTVSGDLASDRAECSTQLVGLATCLPYVQGDGKVPTPDCCSGLKQVLAKTPKCLCVLIKDRDDPQLGLKLNVTLALSLPSVCGAPANISECPKLLNLPPDSKDAQIFKQFGSGSSVQANATSSSGNSTSAGRGGSVVTPASGAERSTNYRRGVERLGVGGILVLVLPLVNLVG